VNLESYLYLRSALYAEDIEIEDLQEIADSLLLNLCLVDPETSNEDVMTLLHSEIVDYTLH